jgi:hypothetical protein
MLSVPVAALSLTGRFTIETRSQDWLSVTVLRWALVLPTAVFGALSIATHGARFLRLTFREYCLLSGTLVVAVLAAGVWAAMRERHQILRKDRGVLLLVLIAGVIGAIMASIYRLPDMDDFAYVPDAVHYLTFPDERMGYTIHYGYLGGNPPFTIIEATSQPFEYVQALAAGLLGVEYLQVYYILTVAVAGFCVPLAIFLLLAHFSDRSRDAALAMLIVVGLLTLLGEGKNTPGSLSFTRIFQGKVVLLAGGLPLFSGLSLDFLGRPSFTRWLILAAAAAAMVGLSTTAFFLMPMLALCLGLAVLAADGWSRRKIVTVAAYGASLWYLVGYALYASRAAGHLLDPSLLPGTWPLTFGGHLAVFLDLERPVTPVVFSACLIIVAVLMRGRRQRLLLLWTAAALVLFLNPVVAPLWISRVTSAPIYWRAFYALPIIAMIGAAGIALLERLPAARPGAGGIVTGVALAACLALNLIPGSTSIYKRGGEIGWPAYKLVDEAVEVSRAVISHAPPGVMLASREISGTTPMLRGGYPQLRIRDSTLIEWLTGQDRAADADLWICASEFTAGQSECLEDFERVITSTGVLETVVIREDVLPLVETLLSDQGFVHRANSGRYWIIWR